MDELLQLIIQFMQELEQNVNELSDEESLEIANFLNEVMGFIQEESQRQQPPEESPILPEENLPEEPPLPMGADLLWILAGGQEDAFINYLRTYPDAGLNSLLRNPELLRQTIDRLNQIMPQGQRGEANGIPQAPIDSSNVYGYQYNPENGTLMVRFQSGSVYQYQGVPAGIFRVFQQGAVPARTSGQNQYGRWWRGKQPSLGAAFYELIRSGGYPYQRVR